MPKALALRAHRAGDKIPGTKRAEGSVSAVGSFRVTEQEAIVEHLVIPGSLGELDTVHDWTRRLLDRAEVPDNLQHNVLLALSECVTNAIRHGCKEDPAMKVKLECRAVPGTITFRVRDKGDGFSPDAVPDPTNGENLLRAGGRGIYLLKALTHESAIDSSDAGTTVSFTFDWQ